MENLNRSDDNCPALRRRSLSTSLVLGLCVCLFAGGCASYQPRLIAQLEPSETPYRQNAGSLEVGVLPLVDKGQVVQFFSGNLRDKDILPILLTFDNEDRSGYEGDLSYIELVTLEGERLKPVASERVYEALKKNMGGRVFGGFLGGAVIAVASFFLLLPAVILMPILSGMSVSGANKKLRRDIQSGSLPSRFYLGAQSLTQGFVYFPLKEGGEIKGFGLEIRGVTPTRKAAGSQVDFRINF